jgi:hypothetical protein
MELKNPHDLAELLDVLRDAGVESFVLGDLAVRFAPAPPVLVTAPAEDRAPIPTVPSWFDVKFPGEGADR